MLHDLQEGARSRPEQGIDKWRERPQTPRRAHAPRRQLRTESERDRQRVKGREGETEDAEKKGESGRL